MVVVVRVRCEMYDVLEGREWGGVKTSSGEAASRGQRSPPRTLLIIATNRCPLTSSRSRWHAVTRERGRPRCLELQTKIHTMVRNHEEGPYYTRAFSCLKGATTAFTFKNLLRLYAKRALIPTVSRFEIPDTQTCHKWQSALRHYANQTLHPLWPLHLCHNFTSTYHGVNVHLACLNSVLNVKSVDSSCFQHGEGLLRYYEPFVDLRLKLY